MPLLRVRSRLSLALLACALAAACDTSCDYKFGGLKSGTGQAPAPAPSGGASPSSAGDSGRPKIVALGDSLTSGLGLLERQAYPALLQEKLDDEGYNFEVVNEGISGDTTAAGAQRIDQALVGDVRILILELGANDGLRGLPTAEMKTNLAEIIERAQARGVAVLLAGMEAPPNYGPEYAAAFRQVYRDLAAQYHVVFMPFLLNNVAGLPALNQSDGIHPTAEGTQIVANAMWDLLKPMADAASAS